MSQPVIESTTPSNISASTLVCSNAGQLLGIFVASASASPTIKVWDSLVGSGTVLVNTFTPVAATFYPLPFSFSNGLYVSIGGTVDCTVGFLKN